MKMEFGDLIRLIDGLAQEFLFQDSKEIDIPAAGKLLNHLEKIVEEAQEKEISTITKCAESLIKVLENIIFYQLFTCLMFILRQTAWIWITICNNIIYSH